MSSAHPGGGPSPPTGPLDRPSAVAVAEQADVLAAHGDYEEAAVLYGRLVGHRDADVHVAALLGLAECRYRLDEEEAALQALIVATQAPETPITWLAWKRLAQVRVREGDLAGAKRAYREAERRAPAEERAEIASRLGWLNKETGNERAARGYFGRARAGGAALPLITYALLAITVGIGVSEFLSPGGQLLLALFGLDKAAVAAGELYRLVSVVLVHSPEIVLHLVGNMYALYLVGPVVEGLYGSARFLAIYLVTAAAASTASYVFIRGDSVGASGAIFGLFGVLLVALRVYRPVLGRQARALTSQIGVLVAFNLLLGFGLGSYIDNAAHVGGLLAGCWIGLLVRPTGAPTQGTLWRVRSAPAASADRRGRSVLDLLMGGAALAVLLAVIALGVIVGTEERRGGEARAGSPAAVEQPRTDYP